MQRFFRAKYYSAAATHREISIVNGHKWHPLGSSGKVVRDWVCSFKSGRTNHCWPATSVFVMHVCLFDVTDWTALVNCQPINLFIKVKQFLRYCITTFQQINPRNHQQRFVPRTNFWKLCPKGYSYFITTSILGAILQTLQ